MKIISKLSKYLKECVINDLSPADFNLIRDGQTQWIVEKIASLAKNKEYVSVFDYGCGNMRLYNALSKTDIKFEYIGVDFESNVVIEKIVVENDNCKFICLSKVPELERNTIDIVCLSNVIHEISIMDFVEILFNTKLLLKEKGHFLLLDMSVLPQGELLGLPYFPDEILDLLAPIDYTFSTKSGYPIIACDIEPNEIKLPHNMLEKLCYIVLKKRDEFSFLSLTFMDKYGVDFFNEKFKKINRKINNEDLLGYTLYLSGLANFRLVEFRQSHHVDDDNEFYVDLINLYVSTFENTGKQLTLQEMYSNLYPKYSIKEIIIKLKAATAPHSLFGYDKDETLYATDRLEYFFDNYTFDDLRKSGILVISAMCEMD